MKTVFSTFKVLYGMDPQLLHYPPQSTLIEAIVVLQSPLVLVPAVDFFQSEGGTAVAAAVAM